MECCFSSAIDEVEKPAFTWCRHCSKSGGCSIYDTKPDVCTSFACGWLEGKGADNERPDRVRLVSSWVFDIALGLPWMITESEVGALDSPVGLRMLEDFLREGHCVVTVSRTNAFVLHIPQGQEVSKRVLAQMRGNGWTIKDRNPASIAAE